MDLIKIAPDKQRTKSLLGTVSVRLELIEMMKKTDIKKYSLKVVEEYYESVMELLTALLYIDGYKTRSDMTGSHLIIINYLRNMYNKSFTEKEIWLIDDLRQKRNGIKYQGKNVEPGYIEMYERQIKQIIEKLAVLVRKRITS